MYYTMAPGMVRTITTLRIQRNFPNYNLLIDNFDNYSSHLIICDDWSQKILHTLSN